MNKIQGIFLYFIVFLLFFPFLLAAQADFKTFPLFDPSLKIPVKKSTIGNVYEDRQLRYSFQVETGVQPPEEERFVGVAYAAGAIAAREDAPEVPQTIFKFNEDHPKGSDYYISIDAEAELLVASDQLVDHLVYVQQLPEKFYPRSAKPEQLEDTKPNSLYPSDTAPISSYLGASTYIGLGGKISYVANTVYNLLPEKDAWSPYQKAYEKDKEIHKYKKVLLFPTENASYFNNALKGGLVQQLSDPQNGLLSLFGGLQYKKTEGKKNSEQHEFQLLSFDRNGEVVHREVITSEEPLQLTQQYPLTSGPYLNGNTRAVSAFLFEAKGHPSTENEELKRKRRFFIVDNKTGKIRTTVDVSLPTVNAVNAGIIDLPNSRYATIVYFHNAFENRGFTFITLDKSTGEVVGTKTFDNAFVDGGGVPPTKLITAPIFTIDAVYGQAPECILRVSLTVKESTTSVTTLGTWLLDYNGNEEGLRSATGTPQNQRFVFVDKEATQIFFYAQDGEGAGARPKLWAFGKGYDGLTNLLPDDVELAGNLEYNMYYSDKIKVLFLLTRRQDGVGLYLHRLMWPE